MVSWKIQPEMEIAWNNILHTPVSNWRTIDSLARRSICNVTQQRSKRNKEENPFKSHCLMAVAQHWLAFVWTIHRACCQRATKTIKMQSDFNALCKETNPIDKLCNQSAWLNRNIIYLPSLTDWHTFLFSRARVARRKESCFRLDFVVMEMAIFRFLDFFGWQWLADCSKIRSKHVRSVSPLIAMT